MLLHSILTTTEREGLLFTLFSCGHQGLERIKSPITRLQKLDPSYSFCNMPTLLHKEKEMNRGKETCVLQQERGEKEVCSVEHFSPELQQLVFLEHSLSGAACVLFHVTYNHPINYMLLFSLPFCMCGNGNTERLS